MRDIFKHPKTPAHILDPVTWHAPFMLPRKVRLLDKRKVHMKPTQDHNHTATPNLDLHPLACLHHLQYIRSRRTLDRYSQSSHLSRHTHHTLLPCSSFSPSYSTDTHPIQPTIPIPQTPSGSLALFTHLHPHISTIRTRPGPVLILTIPRPATLRTFPKPDTHNPSKHNSHPSYSTVLCDA
jgi:hypothetical protein